MEQNRKIAQFMDVKEIRSSYDSFGTEVFIWYIRPKGLYHTSARTRPELSYEDFIQNSKYHTSWDWLMPVIEKISKLELPDPDGSSESWQPFPRTFGMIDSETGFYMFRFNRYRIFYAATLIEAAYTAVLDFIESHTLPHQ